MLNKNINQSLVIALLLIACSAAASGIPEKKYVLRDKIENFECLIATRYPELQKQTMLNAWWPIVWGEKIDSRNIALAAFIYDLLLTSRSCANCLSRSDKTITEFQKWQEEFNKIKMTLLKLDLPTAVTRSLEELDHAVWHDKRETDFK